MGKKVVLNPVQADYSMEAIYKRNAVLCKRLIRKYKLEENFTLLDFTMVLEKDMQPYKREQLCIDYVYSEVIPALELATGRTDFIKKVGV